MDPEGRQAVDALGQRIDTSAAETRAYVEARLSETLTPVERMIRASAEESRRHTGVLVEALRSDVRVATETLVPLARRVDALETRVTRLETPPRPRRRGRK